MEQTRTPEWLPEVQKNTLVYGEAIIYPWPMLVYLIALEIDG